MTRRGLTYPIFILMCLSNLQANEDYWQQFVHYTMDVTLLPNERALLGRQTIEYRNNSPHHLNTFYLHLYANAYRNNNTTLAKDARKYYRKLLNDIRDAGYIQIESFKIICHDSTGNEKVSDEFQVEETILRADLPQPLPPGGHLTLELSFYLKIRKFAGRAGYADSQYDFAQWYPKVCVYDEKGWHTEPFRLVGEFYGEFGTFDVTINVPFQYIVASTGKVVYGDPGWNFVKVDTAISDSDWKNQLETTKAELLNEAQRGRIREVRFYAENVHDFAWAASSDFLYETGTWDGIPIHVLYRSDAKNKWSKTVIQRSVRALQWLSDKFGPYPYPQLTVVHGLLRGGMEYPMLVMNSSERESLILHEIGHIYFYGILANNEFEEAWLDEGLTSFQTRWYMESRYGKWGFDRDETLENATLLQKLRPTLTNREQSRIDALNYINSGHNEPISQPAHLFEGPDSYRMNSYKKGAFFFDMLRYVVGDSTFNLICKEYFQRWTFKHVNRSRFQEVCEEISGQDLEWFFNQWLDRAMAVDYELAKIEMAEDSLWQTNVYVMKKQPGTMPVDVQLITRSGDTLVQRISGSEMLGQVGFQTSDEVKEVVLDPRDAILDNSRFNNAPLKGMMIFEYPNMSFRPRDRLLFTWRPSGWYNNIDKLRIGGRVRGWQATQRNGEIGLWYGTNSNELDARVQYASEIRALSPRARAALMFQKMEGRLEFDANISLTRQRNLSTNFKQEFQFGFNHSRLLGGNGELYTVREFDDMPVQTWSEGTVNMAYVRYSVNPRGMAWLSTLNLGLDTVQKDWGSDFTFSSVSAEAKFWTQSGLNNFYLRSYARKIYDSGDTNTPLQDLIFLEGANPRQRFKTFYLRSDGALPNGLPLHVSGGGNVRGFYNQPITGKEIIAFNFEFRRKFDNKLPWPLIGLLLKSTTLVGFVDLARLGFIESDDLFFADAGVGFRIERLLPDEWYTIFTGGRNLTIRLDFPLWVNKPLPDEKNLQFRWLLGFEQAI